MMLQKRGKHNIVSVSLNPQYIACCLAQADQNSKKITINAYTKQQLTSLEFERSILFNPTKIGHIISQFITKNNITRPALSMAVSGPNVFEKVETLATSSPTLQDFKIGNLAHRKDIKLSHTYLCPSLRTGLNSGFDYYVCAMKREHLFQYRLLTKKIGAQLALITTERSSIIQLYTHTKGQQFNQSQLAIDLAQHNYNFNALVPSEIICKHCHIKKNINIDITTQSQHLATGIGLFLLGKNKWKK